MKLYSYFRSSASYRVRIALNVNNLPYEYVPVHLVRDGGEQLKPEYRAVNVDGIVPTLIDGHEVMPQSLAIIEYLEETHPEPPLLPKAPADRAYVRSLALQVACEIHPLNNLRVLKYLKHTLARGRTTRKTPGTGTGWTPAFATLEAHLAERRAHRQALFRRQADTCTNMTDPAGVQRAALQRRYVEISDHPAHLRPRDANRRIRARRARRGQPDAE